MLEKPTVAAVVLFVAVSVGSAAVAATDLNPEAPPETAQFAFLIGDWDCVTKFMKPDGSGYSLGRARWSGSYILDGWAIQDYWIGYGPDGKEKHGTNIRTFNPETRKWDNQWVAAGVLQWVYFEAEQVGDTMVMIGGEGTDPNGDYVDRNTFYEIEKDSWRWRKDRSYDGGETWFEGVGFIDATRAD